MPAPTSAKPHPAGEAEKYLAKAREAFRRSAKSLLAAEKKHHAAKGRELLSLAHQTATVIDVRPSRSIHGGDEKKPIDE